VQTIHVAVNGDADIEPHETFYVNLTSAGNDLPGIAVFIGDARGSGTIRNDDNYGPLAIASFSASPNPVKLGGTLTLSASVLANGLTLSDPYRIVSVGFYRDDNRTGQIDSGDAYVGYDNNGSDGWTCTLTISGSPYTAGTFTFFARATDNTGQVSNVASTTVTVTKKGGAQGAGASSAVSALTPQPSPGALTDAALAALLSSDNPGAARKLKADAFLDDLLAVQSMKRA
jgi:hypothetical protein